jgi:polyferredoxin
MQECIVCMEFLFGCDASGKLLNVIIIFYTFYQDFMRAMRISNPAMRAIADQMERDEVSRWSNSLTRARVTRWGGMISTPDDVLQVNLVHIL